MYHQKHKNKYINIYTNNNINIVITVTKYTKRLVHYNFNKKRNNLYNS